MHDIHAARTVNTAHVIGPADLPEMMLVRKADYRAGKRNPRLCPEGWVCADRKIV
jgi:hypothetical protein